MDGSTFFSDGKRQIDFVLVFCEHENEDENKGTNGLDQSDTDGEERLGEGSVPNSFECENEIDLDDVFNTRKVVTVHQDPLLPDEAGKVTIPITPNPSEATAKRAPRRAKSWHGVEATNNEEKQRLTRWLSLKTLHLADQQRKTRGARNRARFQAGLHKAGLEMEIIWGDEVTKQGFVLIHAPLAVLESVGEALRVKVPVKNFLVPEIVPAQKGAEVKNCNYLKRLVAKLFEKNFDQDLLRDKKKSRFEPYLMSQRNRFYNSENPEKLFSTADRARIVYEILRSTSYGNKDKEKIGIERLLRGGTYAAAYPLHQSLRDSDELTKTPAAELNQRELLALNWASFGSFRMKQPLDLIRDYFGAKTALYFAFIGVYTRLLTISSLLGVVWLFAVFVMFTTDRYAVEEVCDDNVTILCPICDSLCDFRTMNASCDMAKLSYVFDQWGVFIVGIGITIWAQLFLQSWKRAQASLAYRWGLTDAFYQEKAIRLDFKLRIKTTRIDAVTDRDEPYLTDKKKTLNFLVNCVLVILVAGFIVGTSILTFFLRRYIDRLAIAMTGRDASDTINTLFSSSVVATFHLIIILLFNKVYHLLMYRLVEWECPRTQLDFDNAFILKLFVAEFFNTNSSLFFIAFVQPLFGKHWDFLSSSSKGLGVRSCFSNCFVELSIQMAIIFIGIQLVKAIVESLMPVLIKRGKIYRARFENWRNALTPRYKLANGSLPKPQWVNDFYLGANEPHFLCYEYAELVMQFSVLVLFAPAFPLAALFALLNNLIEIRTDAFKFIRLKQRPVPDEVDSIGLWTTILEGIVSLSVYVNALLVAFTSEFVPAMKWRIRNGSFQGYSNHSHSVYNTRYLSNFAESVRNASTYFNPGMFPEECRYYGFYTPQCINRTIDNRTITYNPFDPKGQCEIENKIEFSEEWYYNTLLRMCFAIGFVFLLSVVRWLICKIYPNVPLKIKNRIAKDQFYAKQSLLHAHDVAPPRSKKGDSKLDSKKSPSDTTILSPKSSKQQ